MRVNVNRKQSQAKEEEKKLQISFSSYVHENNKQAVEGRINHVNQLAL
jgi:hypothetical protein